MFNTSIHRKTTIIIFLMIVFLLSIQMIISWAFVLLCTRQTPAWNALDIYLYLFMRCNLLLLFYSFHCCLGRHHRHHYTATINGKQILRGYISTRANLYYSTKYKIFVHTVLHETMHANDNAVFIEPSSRSFSPLFFLSLW